jgi:predicted RNA methylase
MFYTPAALAESIVNDAVCVHGFSFRGADILEPSAGRGAFVDVLVEKGANVYAAEIDPQNRAVLMQKNINLYTEPDFLKITPKILFDGVFMNPPFARQADIEHVTHALENVKVGGMLFAIMSVSVSFRTDRKTLAFLDLLGDHDSSIVPLPGGAFKESGTNVNAVLVTVTVVD